MSLLVISIENSLFLSCATTSLKVVAFDKIYTVTVKDLGLCRELFELYQ